MATNGIGLGIVARYTDTNNYLRADIVPGGYEERAEDRSERVAGTVTTLLAW